jgi:2-polyprenyl-6-methoxyphenol hydroxylase-like FAD-dependent oxidoreductase
MSNSQYAGEHAIVIGGSLGGLLTARVLSDHFRQVTILERDKVGDAPEVRKGQAHTQHLHALLASGLNVMQACFPGLGGDLAAGGALVGDLTEELRWHAFGGYKFQFKSGMEGVMVSRPYLEWHIRRRVLALPNVRLIDECATEGLVTSDDGARVIGVDTIQRGEGNRRGVYTAALVVDASGRGSPSPKWLETIGYARPAESSVKINVGYATRVYRRRPEDIEGALAIMVSPDAPAGKRSGYAFPAEGDRWYVTMGGWAGDYPPTDEEGFLEYARSLPAPDIYDLLRKLEPITDIMPYRYPASLRRHYERMARFPEGYLVLGDAICSFNPVYGQGMSSAALQTQALDKLLDRAGGRLDALWRTFFAEAAKIVDIPWQLSVGEDFRFAETEGAKAPGTDFINAYVILVHKATHTDPVVYREFVKVVNLLQPPMSLMKPAILWRVWQANRRNRRQTPALAPQTQAS